MNDELRGDHALAPDHDPAADPPRDPVLAAALRELEGGEAPDPDWERMSHSILAAAAPQLARRQQGLHWWQYAAGWAAHAIPVGLAASVALAIGLWTLAPREFVSDPIPTATTALEGILATFYDEGAGDFTIPDDGDELLLTAIMIED